MQLKHKGTLLFTCVALLVLICSNFSVVSSSGVAQAANSAPPTTSSLSSQVVTNLTTCDEFHLNAALATGGYISIQCPANTTITVTTPPDNTNHRSISISTTLDASPSVNFSISGGGTHQLFYVETGKNFSLNGLTIANGLAPANNCFIRFTCGGGIFNSGTLIVTNSTFSSNSAQFGGAIFNDGGGGGGTISSLSNSTFSSNSASSGYGGAIYNNAGTISSLSNSTFSSNSASSGYGGAIFNDNLGTIGSLSNSTFSSNSAQSGGAIYNSGGTISSLPNSTFSSNSAQYGGAILMIMVGTISSLSNSTFSSNSASSGYGGAILNV